MSAFLCLMSGQQAKSAVASAANESTTISALENRFFCHTYAAESAEKRVKRLETFVFGCATTGDTLNNRVAHIAENVPTTIKHRASNAAAPMAQRQAYVPGNYPTVTKLEQDILKKTYEGDAIASRIDRLEIAQFGRLSRMSDLALRVNCLKASEGPSRLMQQIEMRTAPNPLLGSAPTKSILAAAPTNAPTVVDKIEVLEQNAFGKTYPARPLQKRVEFLEKTVLGITPTPADNAITQRVSQLWQKVALAQLPHT